MLKLILILFVLTIVLLIIYKATTKEFFHPAFLLVFYWSLFIWISLILTYSYNLILYKSVFIPICLLLISFVLGALLKNPLAKKPTSIKDNTTNKINASHSTKILQVIVICHSFIALLGLLWQLHSLKINFDSWHDLFEIASTISFMRYKGLAEMPWVSQLCSAFIYSGAFISAIIFHAPQKHKITQRIFTILPLLIALSYTIFNGVKSFFLYAVIIYISGYISALVKNKKSSVSNTKKSIMRYLFICLLILLLVPAIQILRAGKIQSNFKFINASAISYAVSLNNFSIWWHEHEPAKPTFFKYNLSGIHNLFYKDREIGLFSKNNTIGFIDDEKITTNVYTVFRGMIQDFTFFGACIIMFFAGFVSSRAYHFTKGKSTSAFIVHGIILFILLWSFVTNLLNYNTIILSWIIIFISLKTEPIIRRYIENNEITTHNS